MSKFVLFIVEGRNDEREIQAMLHTPYMDDYMKMFVPQFKAMGKDITIEAPKSTSIKNVVSKVVRDWKNGDTAPFNPIKNANIHEIVHVVDLDGAFIPDSSIIADNSVGSFFYEDENIRAAKQGQATQRNGIKRRNLGELCQIKQIDNIPYSIYFMSCNMDHVLSGNRNPAQRYKDTYSFDFGNLCKANPAFLYNNVLAENVGTSLSYEESWQVIQEGSNSLKRRTNFNLYLNRYANY